MLFGVILVAGPELPIRKLVRRVLEAEGFAVLEAATGSHLVEVVRLLKPDLVVLDLLPQSEVVLKSLQEASSGVPVVVLTAKRLSDDRVMYLEIGADDCLTKPFHPGELAARTKALIRSRRFHELSAAVSKLGSLGLLEG